MSENAFPRRGEIWTADVPNDPKVRPMLVVSTDDRNAFASGVLAVPITTNLRPSATHVFLPAGRGGVVRDSMARCENVTLVDKLELVRGPLGPAIDPATMKAIERALMIAFGIAR